jgi:hypothetical protein
MAIAIDSRNTGSSSSSTTTLSWSHTVGAALSNSILLVHVAEASATNYSVTGVNWDQGGTPVALTRLGRINDVGGAAWAEIWYLKSPSAGTKTIQVTFSGTVATCAGSSSWSGVHQTTTFNAASPQTDSKWSGDGQPTIDITSAVGEKVVDCVVDNENSVDTLVVGGGQTTIYNTTVGGNLAGGASDEDGAASVTMSWSGVTNSAPWAIIGCSMIPASGEPPADLFWVVSA